MKVPEDSALQPPCQDPSPGCRAGSPGRPRHTERPKKIRRGRGLCRQATRQGRPLASASAWGTPHAWLWVPTFLVRCLLHTVELCPKEVTDSLTQQLGEILPLPGFFLSKDWFHGHFCDTSASNLYQESLCLHEMTIWYCIWYKTIFCYWGLHSSMCFYHRLICRILRWTSTALFKAHLITGEGKHHPANSSSVSTDKSSEKPRRFLYLCRRILKRKFKL